MPTCVKNKLSIWLTSAQQGFILILPVIILGSIALSILQLPPLSSSIAKQQNLLQLASWLYQSSYTVMALILTLGVSYKLNSFYKIHYQLHYSSIINTIISMVCFIGIIAIDYGNDAFDFLGVESIAKAIITAIISTELVVLFYNNKYQRFSFLQFEVDNEIHTAIRACFPAILVPFLLLTLYSVTLANNNAFSYLIPHLIGEVDSQLGLSVIQGIGFIIINQMVWLLGIHPSAVIEINPELIYSTSNTAVYSRHFFDTYAHIGGSGSTLGLIICLLFSKNTFHKKLGGYAAIPSLFNINELLIFGLPIVLNRYLILPFILTPLITNNIARALMEMGYLSLDPSLTSWNTPVLISGYLSGGIAGTATQFVLILIAASIYWPFVKKYEAKINSQQQYTIEKMIQDLCDPELNFHTLLKQQNPLAKFCHKLQLDLKNQLGDEYFSMHYQAKVNTLKTITGSEALIRWQHPELGNIPPCIFINIAETDDYIHTIGSWVQERCMKDMQLMNRAGIKHLQIAINVSPLELTQPDFFNNFIARIEQYGIPFNDIELEITESQRLQLTDNIIEGISMLSNKGISIAVDDFGMGYTSLKYLSSFKVNTIKLDGCIVKDVLNSNIIKEVIRSLTSLTVSIDGKLVAEWVENEAQFEQLTQLGCDQFQGAYFSMPIKRDDFIAYYFNNKPS